MIANDAESNTSVVPLKVMFAAGGSGGHIMPAVAVYEALRTLDPNVKVMFCSGSRPSELLVYRRLGLKSKRLPIVHRTRGFFGRLKFAAKLFQSWFYARKFVKRFRPQIVVGFGSYISVMPLLAAKLSGAKLIACEQDVHVGFANRLLAPFIKAFITAQPIVKKPIFSPKPTLIGTPLRQDFLKSVNKNEARAFFRLREDRPVCFCVGGSQGAAGLNRIILELIGRMQDLESPAAPWTILWATGPSHFENITTSVKAMGADLSTLAINPYIERMSWAYAAADVVVARSGALTLAELAATERPSILIPLPTSSADHQRKNASRMAESGASIVIEENDPKAAKKLETILGTWLHKPDQLHQMAQSIAAQKHPNAAIHLAKLIFELAGRNVDRTCC